jgi:hypothetical protein
MYFADFYHDCPDGLQRAMGDRGVIILDGRERRETHHALARNECGKRGYDGYRLMAGASLLNARALTEVIRITPEPVWLRFPGFPPVRGAGPAITEIPDRSE